MRVLLPLILGAPVLLAASAPAAAPPIGEALRAAQAEARAAEAEQLRLERAAAAARGEAERLRAEQTAAAQAIVAAEARISAAETGHRLALAQLGAVRARLERQQRPVASLLGGLAMMARRPPLLALADDSSSDEMVRVRLLLDSTLPVIRARTAALSAELERLQRLERRSSAARAQLDLSRSDLRRKMQSFAALEARALERAKESGSGAIAAGDVALAAGEGAERLTEASERMQAAAAIARELAGLGPAPLSPAASEPLTAPLRYQLPAAAAVTHGFGAANQNGVRSRGIVLGTGRGAPLAVPADGIVRFAGPFRDYDGIVIIDHGDGWMSLILNLNTPLKRGSRVRLGQALGRALGPIEVELSRNGRRVSPALIAGSSQMLSNRAKGG